MIVGFGLFQFAHFFGDSARRGDHIAHHDRRLAVFMGDVDGERELAEVSHGLPLLFRHRWTEAIGEGAERTFSRHEIVSQHLLKRFDTLAVSAVRGGIQESSCPNSIERSEDLAL